MEDTPSARYEALVREYGGTRVIRRVLIANNGMAATKFILSVRRWLHLTCGDSSLIKLIGMATPDDIKASAKHVSLANVIEEVRGMPVAAATPPETPPPPRIPPAGTR